MLDGGFLTRESLCVQGTSLLLQASCEEARKQMVVFQCSVEIRQCFPLRSGHSVLDRAAQGSRSEPCPLPPPHLFLRHGAMVQQRKAGDRGQWDVPCHSHTVSVGGPSIAAQTLGLLSLFPQRCVSLGLGCKW